MVHVSRHLLGQRRPWNPIPAAPGQPSRLGPGGWNRFDAYGIDDPSFG
jgi:hypothetical protein